MSIEEKLLALELILKDIRLNWSDDLEYRINAAEKISLDLLMNEKYNKDMECMLKSIRKFKKTVYDVWCDGRYFRTNYPMGYKGMSCLHNLTYTYEDKSYKFKDVVDCLTYPEYAFTDWN